LARSAVDQARGAGHLRDRGVEVKRMPFGHQLLVNHGGRIGISRGNADDAMSTTATCCPSGGTPGPTRSRSTAADDDEGRHLLAQIEHGFVG
jgi:hypothetical protein